MTSSRQITYIIRGLAITTVMVAHYADTYAHNFYSRWMYEYAVAFVALFFVLSGFGIFKSLELRFSDGITAGKILRYSLDRAVSIYPFYWLALLMIAIFVNPDSYQPNLLAPGLRTFAIWLGVPLVRFDWLWFMSALLQCYWLGPALFLALKKLGPIKYGVALLELAGFTLLVTAIFFSRAFDAFHLPAISAHQVLFYKGYFLGHILLFALGMLLGPLSLSLHTALHSRALMVFSGFLFIALVYELRRPDMLFPDSELFLMPLFFASTSLFCLCAIISRPKIPVPFRPIFEVMGKHSYALYLFHAQYMVILTTLGLLHGGFPEGIVVALAVLPPLLLVCVAITAGLDRTRRWLNQKFGRRSLIELGAERA